MSEKDLISARVGLLEITEERIEKMTVCPAHRHGLGKYWQAPKTSQDPRHEGKNRRFLEHMILNSIQQEKEKISWTLCLLVRASKN